MTIGIKKYVPCYKRASVFFNALCGINYCFFPPRAAMRVSEFDSINSSEALHELPFLLTSLKMD